MPRLVTIENTPAGATVTIDGSGAGTWVGAQVVCASEGFHLVLDNRKKGESQATQDANIVADKAEGQQNTGQYL